MATEQACTYDGYTKQTTSANRTAGWKFTPTEDIVVSAIRIKGSAAYTTTAQIWRDSDSVLLTSASVDCINGQWVEQQITPITLYSGIVYIVSQNVYATYGYYGHSGSIASSYYSSKITGVSDVRIDVQNSKPNSTVSWYLAIDFVIREVTPTFKTSGTAVYSSTACQSITNCRSAMISWSEDTPAGTSVSVSAALSATIPADTNYIACTNGGEISSLAGADMSGKTLYIKVTLSTSDTTVTPSFSNLSVTAEDVMVRDFVSAEQYGVYKVTCDISNKIHGITVLNKKTSRLRFASTGERVPVFSTHMFIEGQDKYIDGGYMYDKNSASILVPPRIADTANDSLWEAISANCPSETLSLVETPLTSTDTVSITLT